MVFLEYDVDHPEGDRDSRWWAAHEGEGMVFLPLIMVDSGHRITNGVEDFYDKYRRLVRAELRRPAQARLKVVRERSDSQFHFDIRLTNLSDVTLNSANNAELFAIVYEDRHVADTDRWVQGVSHIPITDLQPGETKSYTLDITPEDVDWDKTHSVVFVDYRPDGTSGAFDMLQAAYQE